MTNGSNTQVVAEVKEFADYLGMDVEVDKDLLWIAVDAMTAKLPEHWEELASPDGQTYYHFLRTGHTQVRQSCIIHCNTRNFTFRY